MIAQLPPARTTSSVQLWGKDHKSDEETPSNVDIQAIGESRSCGLRACSIGREARTYLDLRYIAAIDAKHIRASTKLWPAPRRMTVQTARIVPVERLRWQLRESLVLN